MPGPLPGPHRSPPGSCAGGSLRSSNLPPTSTGNAWPRTSSGERPTRARVAAASVACAKSCAGANRGASFATPAAAILIVSCTVRGVWVAIDPRSTGPSRTSRGGMNDGRATKVWDKSVPPAKTRARCDASPSFGSTSGVPAECHSSDKSAWSPTVCTGTRVGAVGEVAGEVRVFAFFVVRFGLSAASF